jgi:hypothetical protein
MLDYLGFGISYFYVFLSIGLSQLVSLTRCDLGFFSMFFFYFLGHFVNKKKLIFLSQFHVMGGGLVE